MDIYRYHGGMMVKFFDSKNKKESEATQSQKVIPLQELPEPALLKVGKHLDVRGLGALNTTKKFFNEQFTDLFVARRCLEVRHRALHCPIELVHKNGRSLIYYFDETEEETQAIDRVGMRQCFNTLKG